MKKDYLWSLLAIVMTTVLSVGLTSCGGPDPEPSLNISKSTVLFNENGGTDMVSVTANDTEWSVEVLDGNDWLTATKDGDATIRIIAVVNPETQSRNGRVKIICIADYNLSKEITVTQDGKPHVPITLSGTDFTLGGESGSEQSFSVTTTGGWYIKDVPSWLSVSPSKGNGSSSVHMRTLSENYSSTDLRGTFYVCNESGTEQVPVSVTQRAMLAGARTTPSNILIMCFGVAMDFTHTPNVAYYDYQVMRNTELAKYSDKELVEYMKNSSITERKTPGDEWIVSTTNLYSNETTGVDYTIVTVSYDNENKLGEIVKTKFTTKPTANYPFVYADNAGFVANDGSYYLLWDMYGNTYVNTYYTWVVIAKEKYRSFQWGDYLIAWFINKEIKSNKNSHDTNINSSRGYTTSYEHLEGPQLKTGENVGIAPFNLEDNYIQLVSWATGQDGEMSGVINNWTIDLTSNNVPQKTVKKWQNCHRVQRSGKMVNQGVSKKDFYDRVFVKRIH